MTEESQMETVPEGGDGGWTTGRTADPAGVSSAAGMGAAGMDLSAAGPALSPSAALTGSPGPDASRGGRPNPDAIASVVDLAPNAAAWDAFVSRSNPGSYLQTTAWATVKRANGWTAVRFLGTVLSERVARERAEAADRAILESELEPGREPILETELEPHLPADDPLRGDLPEEDDDDAASAASDSSEQREVAFGAQLLLRRPRLFPWAFAYAPRGPVMDRWDVRTIEAFTAGLRHALASAPLRVSHVRIEPEVERDGPADRDGAFRRALRRAGWRPAKPIQPPRTRQVDLRATEEALWTGLRKKWRQYVNKARRSGIRVVDAGPERLPEFYAIYEETARRAGFVIRTYESYVEVWQAFAALGMARLLFAETAEGKGLATLFLLRVGDRVIEPYGGMTEEGAESRANYLLKWEAIRTSREQGAASYDMWGLSHEGIEHFKTGFGGREIRYVGAWDLVLDPAGRLSFDTAKLVQDRVGRWRHGLGRRQGQAEGTEAPE